MNPLLPLLVAALLLSGCAKITGQAMQRLQPGMTKEQVVRITGPANGYQRAGSTEIYTFTDRAIDLNSPNRADFQTVFVDGRLSAWGPTEVRKSNVGVGLVGVYGSVATPAR